MFNTLWQRARQRYFGHDLSRSTVSGRIASTLITFVCVVVAWVFFRASHFDAAISVLRGMLGFNGLVLPVAMQQHVSQISSTANSWFSYGQLEASGGGRQLAWIAMLLFIVWAFPNSQTLIHRLRQSCASLRVAHEFWAWCSLGGLMALVVVLAAINGSHGSSEFIYFNF